MKLAEFIQRHRAQILRAWEDFASTVPEASRMSAEELHDHVDLMLDDIARHFASDRPDHLQPQLPASRADDDGSAEAGTAAQIHGQARLDDGFALDDLIGEYRVLRSTVLHLRREHGTSTGELGIDELMRFDEAVDRALAEAVNRYTARANRARELFLGILGHDMRSPLGSIRMSAEFLRVGDGLGEPQARAVERIIDSSERVKRILDDLLTAAQARLNGRLPVNPEPVDLGRLALQVIEELRSVYASRRIELRTEGSLDGRWDPSRLAQLLSNLIDNALKHGCPDSPVHVDLRGIDDGDEAPCARISVHNEGRPIPPEARAALFEPLIRLAGEVEQHRSDSGLGLGLYIARAIAAAHGGRIDIESSTDNGTTFTAVLPHGGEPCSPAPVRPAGS